MAQLVRAPPCHGGGHGFESRLGRLSVNTHYKFCGILAQLGEHLPYKQGVTGSSPVGPTYLKLNMPMWLNWQSSWFVISRLSVRVRSSALWKLEISGFHYMGRFPSGQRGQTVNLLQLASVVRIHLCPFNLISRGGAVWKLAGLITRRSQVQILSPQLDAFALYAQLAQLVEQRTENPCVFGSIPKLGTFY